MSGVTLTVFFSGQHGFIFFRSGRKLPTAEKTLEIQELLKVSAKPRKLRTRKANYAPALIITDFPNDRVPAAQIPDWLFERRKFDNR
jgi:hypothetical protein